MAKPHSVSKIYKGLQLELTNRSSIREGEFDKFMYEEGIFSHAITGNQTMRFTKRLSIRDEIDCYEVINLPQSLNFNN